MLDWASARKTNKLQVKLLLGIMLLGEECNHSCRNCLEGIAVVCGLVSVNS